MELILIRGLPGSGKTTLAKRWAEENGWSHFEADMFFCQSGSYQFNPRLLPDAHSWCQMSTRDALTEGKTVIVSNTFTQFWEMIPYFQMGKELRVKVTIHQCHGVWPNVHGVPAETLQRMRDRFEWHHTDWEGGE